MNDDTDSLIAVRLLSKTAPALALTAIGLWNADARCADTDPEIFFPSADSPATEARAICWNCPVRDDCLAYALDADEEYGIWGGLDPRERQNLRRRQGTRNATRKSRGAA